jgi:hypothetical protein
MMSAATYGQMAVLIVTIGAYVTAGVWLPYAQKPLAAAIALLLIAALPLAYDAIAFPRSDSEAPGSGLLTAVLWIPALLLLAITSCLRSLRWLLHFARPPLASGKKMDFARNADQRAIQEGAVLFTPAHPRGSGYPV